jgi:nitroreductase
MENLVPELEKRRAKRALSDKPIPQEVVERILKAAILAPSCFNNQPWRFIVAQDPEKPSKGKKLSFFQQQMGYCITLDYSCCDKGGSRL